MDLLERNVHNITRKISTLANQIIVEYEFYKLYLYRIYNTIAM